MTIYLICPLRRNGYAFVLFFSLCKNRIFLFFTQTNFIKKDKKAYLCDDSGYNFYKSMVYNVLKRFFGYTSFRPLQEDIIKRILDGKDVVVLMPTGGGKSLCYQVPALLMEGTAVVVSPLLSLMKDQVEGLLANGVPAAALNSMNDEAENVRVRAACLQGKIKLLYISPERLMLELPYLLKDMRISLFAIDEAHCISQWGHDFRPEYAQLSVLKKSFPGIPVVALTATADRLTREDIQRQLALENPEVFVSSFDRPNISLDVKREFRKKEKDRAIVDFIGRHPHDCGIIYCTSKKTTEAVAGMLAGHEIVAAAYHAGLPAEEREKVQEDFIHDRVQVVCATVAFGMGIDKSNVRFVIHYNLPKSIECFYQEIGRAGRDGLPAETVLFYSLADIVQLSKFARESGQQEICMEKLYRMQEYAESSVCRRRILLNYFGEQTDHDCGNCDVCRNPPQRFDGTILAQKLLSAIARTQQQVSARVAIDILRGNYSQEVVKGGYGGLKTFGVGRDVPGRDWQDYVMQMLQSGLFEIAYDEGNHLKLTASGRQVLFQGKKVQLAVIRREEQVSRQKSRRGKNTEPRLPLVPKMPVPDSDGGKLYEELRALRKRLADAQGFPAYIVLSDKVLQQLCKVRPLTVEDFGGISGIGEFKKEKYGKDFVDVIRRHVR